MALFWKKSCNEKSEYKQKEITNGMILIGLAHSSYNTPTMLFSTISRGFGSKVDLRLQFA